MPGPRTTVRAGPPDFEKVVEKVGLLLNMFRGYISNCASYCSGEHIFRKMVKKRGRMVKNGAKIMSDTSFFHQARVGYIKMS